MPRTDPGLEYFPLDVNIDTDDKIELIEAKHGITGFAVIIRLFMRIYRSGYYYQWGEKEQLLFSKRLNVDINTLNVIIEDAMAWEIFSRTMYNKWQILTSKGIQKRYLEATKRRQKVELFAEYLLLNKTCLNAHNNILIVNIKPDNANISTQSKVKESKVKESKKIYAPAVSMKEEEYQKLIERFGEDETKDRIERLSLYKKSTGKKYKCDYSTILAWARKDEKEKGGALIEQPEEPGKYEEFYN
jgi:hypothetical protein